MRSRLPKDGLAALFAEANWPALWRLFVFAALAFFIFVTVRTYLDVVRPLAVATRLEELQGRLETRIGGLRSALAEAEAKAASAESRVADAEARRTALEAEILQLEARRAAPKQGAAPAAAAPPVSADRQREFEREIARRDQEIATLRKGLAELRADPRRSGGGSPLTMSMQERRRFVVQEFVAKVAILANRNRIQLEFAKAMVAAVRAYDAAGSPFPEGMIPELFLRNYPRLRGIDLFTTGGAIVDRQIDSVEFMLLEEGERSQMQGRVRQFVGTTPSFAQPLLLQLDAGATPEQFQAELGRVESAFNALFQDLERLQTELLGPG